MPFENGSQIIVRKRLGNQSDPFIEIDETHIVDKDGRATLSEYPEEFSGVRVAREDGSYLYEVRSGIPDINQYKVDYRNKFVEFNVDNIGKQFRFVYMGTGMTYLSVDSIYTKQMNGEVTETLKSLTDETGEARDIAKKINEDVQLAENTRISNETARQNSEVSRRNAETERESNEDLRQTAEDIREQFEDDRQSAESLRAQKETERINAETVRGQNEQQRQNQESSRVSAEDLRKQQESTRESNEDVRVQNENTRKTEHSTRMNEATEIIDNTKFSNQYSDTTTYHKNNVVSFNGSSYMAKQTTVGNPPPNPLESTENEYWGLVGRKGADGNGTVTTHRDAFIATEGQELFELTYTYDQYQNRTTVYVGGVPQKTPANYEEVNNKHIRIPGGVPSGVEVIVEYFSESIPLQSDIQTTVNNHSTELNKLTRQTLFIEEFVAAEGQKSFTLSREYEPMQDKVRVIVDGVEQDSGDNFIESSNTSITLSEGVPVGTEVKVEYYTRTVPIATDVETQLNNHANTLAEHTAFKQSVEDEIGTEDLQTSNKTIKGAINEVFQSGNNVKQSMVDKLLSVNSSLPITHDSTWGEIETATGQINVAGRSDSGKYVMSIPPNQQGLYSFTIPLDLNYVPTIAIIDIPSSLHNNTGVGIAGGKAYFIHGEYFESRLMYQGSMIHIDVVDVSDSFIKFSIYSMPGIPGGGYDVRWFVFG